MSKRAVKDIFKMFFVSDFKIFLKWITVRNLPVTDRQTNPFRKVIWQLRQKYAQYKGTPLRENNKIIYCVFHCLKIFSNNEKIEV